MQEATGHSPDSFWKHLSRTLPELGYDSAWLFQEITNDPFSKLKEGEALRPEDERVDDLCLPAQEEGGKLIVVCRAYVLYALLIASVGVPGAYFYPEIEVG